MWCSSSRTSSRRSPTLRPSIRRFGCWFDWHIPRHSPGVGLPSRCSRPAAPAAKPNRSDVHARLAAERHCVGLTELGHRCSLQACLPIARLAAIVGNHQHPQFVGGLQVDHVVRKARHGKGPDRHIAGHAWHGGASARELENAPDSGIDLVEELDTEAVLLGVIPAAGFTYSASASFSKRTGVLTVCGEPLQREPAHPPRRCPAIRQP